MALARLFINRRRAGGCAGVAAVMGVVAVCAAPGGVAAQEPDGYQLCNETSYVLEAAVGTAEGDAWSSRGWWRLLPGECRQVLEETSAQALYFVHARSLPAHVGEGRQFFGDVGFCVAEEDFSIEGAEFCEARHYLKAGFLPVTMKVDGWTTALSEPAGWSRKQARIAGLQRLLDEIGFSPGGMDGVAGGQTRRALAKFNRKAGLPDSKNITDELLEALVAARQEIADASGLTLCNRSPWLVWGAAGRRTGASGGEEYLSSGWIRVPAGECAKALQGPLESRDYYAYAEAVTESGEPALRGGAPLAWGGDAAFCTKKPRFSIVGRDDCLKRGYDEHGFATIDPGGARHFIWTVE